VIADPSVLKEKVVEEDNIEVDEDDGVEEEEDTLAIGTSTTLFVFRLLLIELP